MERQCERKPSFKMALPIRKTRLLNSIGIYLNYSCNLLYHGNVRVRFAPSPTGMLHLGGLRTALFNYLFAKSNRGNFVLRIEDTDQTRKVPEAVEKLENILQWTGIVPDESPLVGGPYGPYFQSQRCHLYTENVKALLKSGHCYHCFCTDRRLNLLRKDAAKRGEPPRYDNKCRHLTEEEVNEKKEKNIPYVIRFKYEPLESPWTDLVYGVMHERSVGDSLEGDFIVMKTDGFPTYHFANVVDDHYMKISHVLRGEEWIISTPKHLQMYKAFGWVPPSFAHLPLIINSDGTKLSKRQGDITVEHFKEQNYHPDAVLNYLTTVSGAFTETTEGKNLQEMISVFSLDNVTSHSARLQPEKLKPLNRLHLHREFHGDQKENMIANTKEMVQKHYAGRLASSHVLDSDYIERILAWALEYRISHLEDLITNSLDFIWVFPDQNKVRNELLKDEMRDKNIQQTIEKLNLVQTFKEASLKEVLVCYCSEHGLIKKLYMKKMRSCLSDQKEGPSVPEMMEILGKQETIRRLQGACHSVTVMKDMKNTDTGNKRTLI